MEQIKIPSVAGEVEVVKGAESTVIAQKGEHADTYIVIDNPEALTLAHAIIERYGEWLPVKGIDRIYSPNEQISMWVRAEDEKPIYATYASYRFFGTDGKPIEKRLNKYQPIAIPKT